MQEGVCTRLAEHPCWGRSEGSRIEMALWTNYKSKDEENTVYNMETLVRFFCITYCNEHFNIFTMLCKREKVSFYMRVKRQILVTTYPKFLTDNLPATEIPLVLMLFYSWAGTKQTPWFHTNSESKTLSLAWGFTNCSISMHFIDRYS